MHLILDSMYNYIKGINSPFLSDSKNNWSFLINRNPDTLIGQTAFSLLIFIHILNLFFYNYSMKTVEGQFFYDINFLEIMKTIETTLIRPQNYLLFS